MTVLTTHLLAYPQIFPYAKPDGAIEATTALLLAIHGDPIYAERNPKAAAEPAATMLRTMLTVRGRMGKRVSECACVSGADFTAVPYRTAACPWVPVVS
jgi:hypothetical protein